MRYAIPFFVYCVYRLDFSETIDFDAATGYRRDGEGPTTYLQIPGMNQFLRILHISPRCIILLEFVIRDMRQAIAARYKDLIE